MIIILYFIINIFKKLLFIPTVSYNTTLDSYVVTMIKRCYYIASTKKYIPIYVRVFIQMDVAGVLIVVLAFILKIIIRVINDAHKVILNIIKMHSEICRISCVNWSLFQNIVTMHLNKWQYSRSGL